MNDLLLAPTALAAKEFMGEMPLDPLCEVEFDLERLLRAIAREQRKLFNQAYNEALVTYGVTVSDYCLSYDLGYGPTYVS